MNSGSHGAGASASLKQMLHSTSVNALPSSAQTGAPISSSLAQHEYARQQHAAHLNRYSPHNQQLHLSSKTTLSQNANSGKSFAGPSLQPQTRPGATTGIKLIQSGQHTAGSGSPWGNSRAESPQVPATGASVNLMAAHMQAHQSHAQHHHLLTQHAHQV